jgi:hypothetical protein
MTRDATTPWLARADSLEERARGLTLLSYEEEWFAEHCIASGNAPQPNSR